MFLLVSLSVLGVIALGPQVVLGSFKFKLPPVVECEPVDIVFSGSNNLNHSVPTTLTIIPLLDNVSPIQISIPNGATNSTGIQLTFIPLPADTLFLATLDDIEDPSAKVSDVTKVTSSNNTAGSSCVGVSLPQTTFYQFDDVLNQCESFTINYTTPTAPNIRAFTPRGGSVQLIRNQNSDAVPGQASYTVDVNRQQEVVLLFDDNNGSLQTTKLITVGGDSTSNKTCFPHTSASDSNPPNTGPKTKNSALPKAAVIGIAVGASVVGLLAILLLLYVIRERRRRRGVPDMDFDPTLLDRKWPPDLKNPNIYDSPRAYNGPPSFTASPPFMEGAGFVRDPIYTDEKYAASVMSDARTSIGSWKQFVPDDQRSQRSPGRRGSSSSSRLSNDSMNTTDIHNILQMATVHRDRSSSDSSRMAQPGAPQPSTAGTTRTFNVAKPAVARLVSLRRNGNAEPPDMPVAVSRNNSATVAAIAGVPAGYGPSSYTMPSPYMSFEDSDDEGARQSDGVDGIGGFPVPVFKQPGNPRDTSESWGNVVVR
ncbi:hypothetical protein C8R44DRAFT_977326 [Mycena epipterygia]|nr:hypothetical protein C8R44DRAFT_977326 [Mycena epipterygia]